MKRSMTARCYAGWRMYWEHEPWGTVRDNLHAAIVARELRVQRARPGTKVTLEPFLFGFADDEGKPEKAKRQVISALSLMAQRVTPAEARRMRRKHGN